MQAKRMLVLSVTALAFVSLVGCASTSGGATSPSTAPTSATVGNQTIVAIQSAPQPKFTGELLRTIAGGVTSVTDAIRNRLGMRFPGLERKPPLLSITDPANLDEQASPAVQAAAKVKAEEDAARQKIKALRFLATIGCGGCYPDVEDALLAALDDCTEEVRYEAVMALRSTVGDPCKYCKADACCGPKVRKKLKAISYNLDETGCFEEPSERVRRQARLALNGCGGAGPEEIELLPEEGPEELPTPAPTPAPPTAGESLVQSGTETSGSSTLQGDARPVAGSNGLSGANATATAVAAAAATLRGEPAPIRQVNWQDAIEQATVESGGGRPVTQVSDVSASENMLEAVAATPYPQDDSVSAKRLYVAWEQIHVNPKEFDSPERAQQVILYLRARARGIEMAAPDFSPDEVHVQQFQPTLIDDIEWSEARKVLQKLPTGGVSPILTRKNEWFLFRQLARIEK